MFSCSSPKSKNYIVYKVKLVPRKGTYVTYILLSQNTILLCVLLFLELPVCLKELGMEDEDGIIIV